MELLNDLTFLTEKQIESNYIANILKKRLEKSISYTYIGDTLVSVNPLKDLGDFSDERIQSFVGKALFERNPHIYGIAEKVLQNMISTKRKQCIFLTGPTCSGKSVICEHLIRYICSSRVSENEASIELLNTIKKSVKLLKAFGNAATIDNSDSSRCVKYYSMNFDLNMAFCSARINQFQTETSRITNLLKGERSFHIFYQLCNATDELIWKDELEIAPPSMFRYLSSSGCEKIDSINDKEDFKETLTNLAAIGLSPLSEACKQILRLVSAILWLGNIEFSKSPDGSATISEVLSQKALTIASKLLGLNSDALQKSLTKSFTNASVSLKVDEANHIRDMLAQSLYQYIISRIVFFASNALQGKSNKKNNNSTNGSLSVALFDLFGYHNDIKRRNESCKTNSLETLTVNYCCEKMNSFVRECTNTDLRLYQSEGINVGTGFNPNMLQSSNMIRFFEDEDISSLGFFPLLRQLSKEFSFDNATNCENSLQKSLEANPKNKSLVNFTGKMMQIKHFFGSAEYDISGIFKKFNCLEVASKHFELNISSLFSDTKDLNLNEIGQFVKTLNSSPMTICLECGQCSKSHTNSANTNTHSIICFSPNNRKDPSLFDSVSISDQINSHGLTSIIQMKKTTFVFKETFENFVSRYSPCIEETAPISDYKTTAKIILNKLNFRENVVYVFGQNFVFIKDPETVHELECLRKRFWHKKASIIVKALRDYKQTRDYHITNIQNVFRSFMKTSPSIKFRLENQYIFQHKRERKVVSLLSIRQYFGDYLGVERFPELGDILLPAMSDEDVVLFASKGYLLVTVNKALRLSPRLIILTTQKLFIVKIQMVDSLVSYRIDREELVEKIARIKLSTFQDPFVFLYFSGNVDLPLCCDFNTEFATHILHLMPNVLMSFTPTIEFSQKKGSKTTLTFVKDEKLAVLFEIGKNNTIRVKPGFAPGSETTSRESLLSVSRTTAYPRKTTLRQHSFLTTTPKPRGNAPNHYNTNAGALHKHSNSTLALTQNSPPQRIIPKIPENAPPSTKPYSFSQSQPQSFARTQTSQSPQQTSAIMTNPRPIVTQKPPIKNSDTEISASKRRAPPPPTVQTQNNSVSSTPENLIQFPPKPNSILNKPLVSRAISPNLMTSRSGPGETHYLVTVQYPLSSSYQISLRVGDIVTGFPLANDQWCVVVRGGILGLYPSAGLQETPQK